MSDLSLKKLLLCMSVYPLCTPLKILKGVFSTLSLLKHLQKTFPYCHCSCSSREVNPNYHCGCSCNGTTGLNRCTQALLGSLSMSQPCHRLSWSHLTIEDSSIRPPRPLAGASRNVALPVFTSVPPTYHESLRLSDQL